ncbi:unnamed protein product [Caretta caretta]
MSPLLKSLSAVRGNKTCYNADEVPRQLAKELFCPTGSTLVLNQPSAKPVSSPQCRHSYRPYLKGTGIPDIPGK